MYVDRGQGLAPSPIARPGGRSFLLAVALGLGIAAVAIAGVFRAAEWYGGRVSLPRFCADPEGAIALVERITTQTRPAGEQAMRPYVIAAKLIYLVPRRDGEALDAYLARLRRRIEESCG